MLQMLLTHLQGLLVVQTCLLRKKAQRIHQSLSQSLLHNNQQLPLIELKVHLFPSIAQIMEEGEGVILVKMDLASTALDPGGAMPNILVNIFEDQVVPMGLHNL